MIPIEIEPINFLAYRDPGPLNLEGIHVACLAGPNGAGKSSLLDAITWALWGRARSNSPDDLFHQVRTPTGAGRQDDMSVSLVFEQGEARYRVIRQRQRSKRGATLLEFQIWVAGTDLWRPLSERTMRGTQARIDDLLRLDYETFINSAFLMQGRADEFTTKTPAQRKQVLSNILGLTQWEEFEGLAKTATTEARVNLDRVDERLKEIDGELQKRDQRETEVKAAEVAAEEITKRLTELEKTWADLEGARTQLVALQRQIDDSTRRINSLEREMKEGQAELQTLSVAADHAALKASLAQIEADLEKLKPVAEELECVRGKQKEVGEEAARLNGINEALGPETEPIKGRIATLESASEPLCPTCGQPLTEDHREELIQELEQQLKEAQSAAKRLEQDLKVRPALEKQAAEIQAAIGQADAARQQVEALQARLDRWSKESTQEKANREKLEMETNQAESRLKSASISSEDLDRVRKEKRMADERVGGARQQLTALDTLAAQKTERLKEREELAEDLSLLEELREAFGKRGVPAMIIETAVPELERGATELLKRLTDGRMNLRIETQREIKTGEVREALDIIISDELGSRPYEMYSGGEAFRINFAIRIALSRLLAQRAGAQLRSLFIDEGFGTQDARGREHLVSAITSIQDDFELILIITHIDELKEAFPARIEVTKTAEGSRYLLT
jgi:exonuclease SbcC